MAPAGGDWRWSRKFSAPAAAVARTAAGTGYSFSAKLLLAAGVGVRVALAVADVEWAAGVDVNDVRVGIRGAGAGGAVFEDPPDAAVGAEIRLVPHVAAGQHEVELAAVDGGLVHGRVDDEDLAGPDGAGVVELAARPAGGRAEDPEHAVGGRLERALDGRLSDKAGPGRDAAGAGAAGGRGDGREAQRQDGGDGGPPSCLLSLR